MVVFLYVGVFCFFCGKEHGYVRWVELRGVISCPLNEPAISKAVQ